MHFYGFRISCLINYVSPKMLLQLIVVHRKAPSNSFNANRSTVKHTMPEHSCKRTLFSLRHVWIPPLWWVRTTIKISNEFDRCPVCRSDRQCTQRKVMSRDQLDRRRTEMFWWVRFFIRHRTRNCMARNTLLSILMDIRVDRQPAFMIRPSKVNTIERFTKSTKNKSLRSRNQSRSIRIFPFLLPFHAQRKPRYVCPVQKSSLDTSNRHSNRARPTNARTKISPIMNRCLTSKILRERFELEASRWEIKFPKQVETKNGNFAIFKTGGPKHRHNESITSLILRRCRMSVVAPFERRKKSSLRIFLLNEAWWQWDKDSSHPFQLILTNLCVRVYF